MQGRSLCLASALAVTLVPALAGAAEVVVDTATTWTASPVGPDDDLVVNAVLTLRGGFDLVVRSVTVSTPGVISADGEGFAGGVAGPGAGPGGGPGGGAGCSNGSGAGHGGGGGGNALPGGVTYGSALAPDQAGSGGGACTQVGGAGGGRLRIIASQGIVVNGKISANGKPAGTTSGGGSGGSVWLTAASLDGAGAIQAIGGGGQSGGGGGRVALEIGANGFTGAVSAAGGTASVQRGAGGTITRRGLGETTAALEIGAAGAITPVVASVIDAGPWTSVTLGAGAVVATTGGVLDVPVVLRAGAFWTTSGAGLTQPLVVPAGATWTSSGGAYAEVTVESGGVWNASGLLAVTSVTVAGTWALTGSAASDTVVIDAGGVLTHDARALGGLELVVAGDLTVAAGALVDADGKGYAGGANGTSGAGPGGGLALGSASAGGGAHGGDGGDNTQLGGEAYGSPTQPLTLGSGGGARTSQIGGNGGGLVRLDVGGTLTVDGTVRANGTAGTSSAGGGAGGSVWLSAGTFAGAGVVRAGGGAAGTAGAGGGGGRLVLDRVTHAFTGTVAAPGGAMSAQSGAGGTLYFLPEQALQVDAAGIASGPASTPLAPGPFASLTLRPSARARIIGQVFAVPTTLDMGATLITDGTTRAAATVVGAGATWLGNDDVVGDVTVTGAWTSTGSLTAEHVTVSGTWTHTGAGNLASLAVTGVVTHPAGATDGLQLAVAGALDVLAGGAIDVSVRGYAGGSAGTSGAGPGGGLASGSSGAGGGAHGGDGGDNVLAGGNAYGSQTAPADLGSGGGARTGQTGGRGGGRVRLAAGGVVTLDGAVRANGGAGTTSSGGGAGGSIWILAPALTGAGVIEANGGSAASGGAGGGGGRVAIDAGTYGFAGTPHALGGAVGALSGSGGTLFTRVGGAAEGALVVDAAGAAGTLATTPVAPGPFTALTLAPLARARFGTVVFTAPVTAGNGAFLQTAATTFTAAVLLETGATWTGADDHLAAVTVASGAAWTATGLLDAGAVVVRGTWTLTGHAALASLAVEAGGLVTHAAGGLDGVRLDVAGDASVHAGGAIDASARGYAGGNAGTSGAGPGGGLASGSSGAGGGAHGGEGGDNTLAGGEAYGSAIAPDQLGSGGGARTGQTGGRGGGRVRLEVAGTLSVDGAVLASGGVGTTSSGGGAGGSVWLTAGTFAGAGGVLAHGGGAGSGGAGGGGGRIAIERGVDLFTGTLGAAGGAVGALSGAGGTLFTRFTAEAEGALAIDASGSSGATGFTPVAAGPFVELTVRPLGRARVTAQALAVPVAVNGVLASSGSTFGDVTVAGSWTSQDDHAGDVAVAAGASLTAGGELFAESVNLAGAWTLNGTAHATAVNVAATGTVTHAAGQLGGLALDVTGDLELLGAIDVSARGYAGGSNGTAGGGPGGGLAGGCNDAGGGAHGGEGGPSQNPGGLAYGSAFAPADLGSGGGADCSQTGGRGGGRVRLDVGGALTLSGTINADGGAGTLRSGGGGGGSVWLSAGSLTGAGLVRANGGGASTTGGAGGGGGRIALEAASDGFTGALSAAGVSFADRSSAGGTIVRGGALLVAPAGTGATVATPFGDVAATLAPAARGRTSDLVFTQSVDFGAGSVWLTDDVALTVPFTVPAGATWLATRGSAPDVTVAFGGTFGLTGPASYGALAVDGTASINGAGTGDVHVRVGGVLTCTAGASLGFVHVQGTATATACDTGDVTVDPGATYTLDGPAQAGAVDVFGTWVATGAIGAGGVVIHTGGVARHKTANSAGMALTVAGDLVIAGAIDLTARGYAGGDSTTGSNFARSGQGPGAGASGNICDNGSGAGHAGPGGRSAVFAGGVAYGSLTEPNQLGSGGGSYCFEKAGSGGGYARLEVAGTLLVDGAIDASGTAGTPQSGGGSGGSLRILAGTLAGAGAIRANGGNGGSSGGGGGAGGRIALTADSDQLTGALQAKGGNRGSGSGVHLGGAGGTIYRHGGGLLVIDAAGVGASARNTLAAGPWTSVTLRSGALLTTTGAMESSFVLQGTADWSSTDLVTAGTVTLAAGSSWTQLRGSTGAVAVPAGATWNSAGGIAAGAVTVGGSWNLDGLATVASADVAGVMSHAAAQTAGLHLVVNGSMNLGGSVNVTGDGYADGGNGASGGGPGGGTGGTACLSGGGGGYGGAGGAGQVPGGTTYGSATAPVDLGSAGGSYCSAIGGDGGGRVRLEVAGTLNLAGSIRADGISGASRGGGGAGGSVWLTLGAWTGGGLLTALGGAGVGTSAGGGGGGRIAVEYGASSFAGTVDVGGGARGSGTGAHEPGQAGTYVTQLVVPEVAFVATPSDCSASATFEVASSLPGSLFALNLDGAGAGCTSDLVEGACPAGETCCAEGLRCACPLSSCASAPRVCFGPWTLATTHVLSGLAEGPHTLYVQAQSGAGVLVEGTLSHAWTVDTLAPDVAIAVAPPPWHRSLTAAFTVTTTQSGAYSALLDDPSGAYDPLDETGWSAWLPLGASASVPLVVAQGPHTVAFRVRDACGNVDPTPASYTWISDVTPPVIDPGPALTFACSGPLTPVSVPAGVVTDNLDPALAPATHDAPASFAVGAHTVTYRATDAAGNQGTATLLVTVQDGTAPALACPPDGAEVAACTGPGSVAATASDLCDPAPVVALTAGALVEGASSSVTYTATDASGNHASCTRTVTVALAPPSLTCPAALTVEQADAAGTAVTVPVTASDTCDAAVAVSHDGPAVFPLGATSVTFTALDDAGGTATCTTVVTVRDTTAPSLLCPAPVTVEQVAHAGTPVALVASASDACDASPVVTHDGPAVYPLGATTVRFTARDASGNARTCTTVVTVRDTTAPLLECPAGPLPVAACDVPAAEVLAASDACDVAPVVTAAPARYPRGVSTVTFTATDATGNTVACAASLDVTDGDGPVFSALPATVVECALPGGVAGDGLALAAPAAADACGGEVSFASYALPAFVPLGTSAVVWRATDEVGNESMAAADLVVTDTVAPLLIAPPPVGPVAQSGPAQLTVVPRCSDDASGPCLDAPLASDACDDDLVVNDDAPEAFPLGLTVVTFTTTDASGNVASDTTTVTVVDTDPPAPPSGLAAEESAGRILVSWTRSPTADVVAHRVYRAYGAAPALEPAALLASTTAAGLVDAGLQVALGYTVHYAVTAVDASGNQSAPALVAVTVSAGGPLVTITPAASLLYVPASGAVQLGATATHAAPVAATRLLVDGVEVAAAPGRVLTYLWHLTPGVHGLRAEATDTWGRTGFAEREVTVAAAALAPEVVAALDRHGDGVSMTLDWSGYGEDPPGNGGVAYYRIYVASAPFASVEEATLAGTTARGVRRFTARGLVRGATSWLAVAAVTVEELARDSFDAALVSGVPIDVVAPEEVRALRVSAVTRDSATLLWDPSPNTLGDLVEHRIGAASTGGTSYTLEGLAPSSGHTVTVRTADADLNVSAGVSLTFATLLDNPALTALTPDNGRVSLAFAAQAPLALTTGFRVYRSTTAFTSVAGMAPALSLGKTATTATLTGLANGVPVHVAVTAVGLWGVEHALVTSASATPRTDVTGPTLTNIRANGVALASPHPVNGAVQIDLGATDASGVAGVHLAVDGATYAADPAAPYSLLLDACDFVDGAHTMSLVAADGFGNTTVRDFAVSLRCEPPPSPVLTAPAAGAVFTGSEAIAVSGTAAPFTRVQVLVSGVPAGAPFDTGVTGTFSVTGVALPEGESVLRATATNRAGTSALSAPRTVTRDTVAPAAPGFLQASPRAGGEVVVTWRRPETGETPAGYHVYRDTAPVTAASPGLRVTAARVVEQPAQTPPLRFVDTPPADGTYYYAATAVDGSGNESAVSASDVAVSDRTAPELGVLVLDPRGAFDPLTGRLGVGEVRVRAETSEATDGVPFLNLVTPAGSPITVSLNRAGERAFTGAFQIGPATSSGPLTPVFSARDAAGNRGTSVTAPFAYSVDTAGPRVSALALDQPLPLHNLPPLVLAVTLTLDDDPSEPPSLSFSLGAGAIAASLQELAPRQWRALLAVPENAGATPGDRLTLLWDARDDLGNRSTTIVPPHDFEVFQGELPALEAPLGFAAEARPAGAVHLAWSTVPGAATYRVYRRAPGESAASLLAEVAATSFADLPGPDGAYAYSVASVREALGLIAESAPTASQTVEVDSIPPNPPLALALALGGSGVQATWSPPAGEAPDVYRLYRASAPIAAVAAAERILDRIRSLAAVDRDPSEAAHHYAVTAVDRAGNESAPSASAFLDFALLPPRVRTVTRVLPGAPALCWSASAASVATYRVYRVNGAERVLVSAEPLLATCFDDSGYAGGTRTYEVTVVSSEGLESLGHRVTLPGVALTVADEVQYRGSINTVPIDVRSTGAEPIALAWVRLDVQGRMSTSDPFDLAAGASRRVEVLTGGEATLPATSFMTAHFEQEPEPGTTVRISRGAAVPVVTRPLAAELFTGELVRDTVASVRFAVHNPSDHEAELVTAQGDAASPDIHLRLRDRDGNVLATAGYTQRLGGVILVPGGTTIARIPAGQSFESQPIALTIPASAPDQVVLELVIDAFHHGLGGPAVVHAAGLTTRLDGSLEELPYRGTVEVVGRADLVPAERFLVGEEIHVTGQMLSTASGLPMPFVPYEVGVLVRGFLRTIAGVTDLHGRYRAFFTPTFGQAGRYVVFAGHPDMSGRPEMAAFHVDEVALSHASFDLEIPRTFVYQHVLTFTNQGAQPVADLRFADVAVLDELGVSPVSGVTAVPAGSIAVLEPGASASIAVAISGDESAPARARIVLGARMLAGGVEVRPGSSVVNLRLRPQVGAPSLAFTPSYIETGVVKGGQVTERVTIRNQGYADARGVRLTLRPSAGGATLPWITLSTTPEPGDLAVGASHLAGVTFMPPASTPDGFYSYALEVTGDNLSPATYLLVAAVSSDAVGSVDVHVVDLFLGQHIAGAAPGVVNNGVDDASVRLTHAALPTLVFTRNTGVDHSGAAFFQDLPAGLYAYRVSAPGHETATGTLRVKPGITVSESIFLDASLVSVEWTVTPTTIEDHYEITLSSTFVTNVPAPVVLLQPRSINLPADMRAGDVLHGEYVITNQGLAGAQDASIRAPASNGWFEVRLLGGVPPTLAARQTIRVPYTITALRDFKAGGDEPAGKPNAASSAKLGEEQPLLDDDDAPDDDDDGGGDDDDAPCLAETVGYAYSYDVCVAGVWRSRSASADGGIFAGGPCIDPDGGDLAGGPGGRPQTGGFGGSTLSGCPAQVPTCDGDCSGSFVNRGSGEYTFAETDLTLQCRGPDIALTRNWAPAGHDEAAPPVTTHTLGTSWLTSFASRLEATALPSWAADPTYAGGRCVLLGDGANGGGGAGGAGAGGGGGTTAASLPCPHDDPEAPRLQGLRLHDPGRGVRNYVPAGSVHAPATGYYETRIEPLSDGSYIWRAVAGHWRQYSAQGRLEAYGDRVGNTVDIEHDALGRIARVVSLSSPGQRLEFEYASPSSLLVTAVVDGEGRRVEYVYDGEQLREVQAPGGRLFGYTYNDASQVDGKRDETGREVVIEYLPGGGEGAQDHVVSAVRELDGARVLRSKEYDLMHRSGGGSSMRVNAADGRSYETTADALGNVLTVAGPQGVVLRKEYELHPNKTVKKVTTRDDDGVLEVINYDLWGRITGYTDALGHATRFEYTDLAENPRWSLLRRRHNPDGTVDELERDAHGNLVRATTAAGTPEAYSERFAYDAYGQKLARWLPGDPDDRPTVTWTYDELGRIASKTARLDDSRSVTTTHVRSVQPDGGELLSVTRGRYSWRFLFDASGRPVEEQVPGIDGPFATYRYDGRGRVLEQVLLPGRPMQRTSRLTYTPGIDDPTAAERAVELGLPARETEYDGYGRPVKERDELGAGFDLDWDEHGRVAAITDVLGSAASVEYPFDDVYCPGCGVRPPRTLSGTGPSGRTVHHTLDRLGRVVRRVADGESTELTYDALGSVLEVRGGGRTLRYTYDLHGRHTGSSVEDAAGLRTLARFVYDARGNLAAAFEGGSSSPAIEYTYLLDGRMASATRRGGAAETYHYDDSGDLVEERHADGSRRELVYDLRGQLATVRVYGADGALARASTSTIDDLGAPAAYADAFAQGAATRDLLGRVTSERVVVGPVDVTFSYTYHANDLRASMTTPEGTVSYAYSPMRRLTSMGGLPGGVIVFGEHHSHLPGRVTLPNGIATELEHDGRMLLTGVRVSGPAGPPLYDVALTYDRFTNLRTRAGSESASYEYDGDDRLLAVDRPPEDPRGDESYTYEGDDRFARASAAGVAYGYDGAGRLTSAGDTSYVYDDAGSLIEVHESGDLQRRYSYDAARRLSVVADGAGVEIARYTYDALGRRVSKTAGGETRWFVHGIDGLLAEYDGGGALIAAYGYGPTGAGAAPYWMQRDGETYYFAHDERSSPILATDAAGEVVWRQQLDAFGAAVVEDDPDGDGHHLEVPFRLPGQYYDSETGLIHNQRRYYDPALGRFLTQDPAGAFPTGSGAPRNLYQYARQNPYRWLDRSGAQEEDRPNIRGAEFYKESYGARGFGGGFGTRTIVFCEGGQKYAMVVAKVRIGLGVGESTKREVEFGSPHDKAPEGDYDAGLDVKLNPAKGKAGRKVNLKLSKTPDGLEASLQQQQQLANGAKTPTRTMKWTQDGLSEVTTGAGPVEGKIGNDGPVTELSRNKGSTSSLGVTVEIPLTKTKIHIGCCGDGGGGGDTSTGDGGGGDSDSAPAGGDEPEQYGPFLPGDNGFGDKIGQSWGQESWMGGF